MLGQADHQGLLIRQAFGHQQGQCHQGVIVDQPFHGPGQQMLIAAQVPEEQKGAAALVAVGQRVVLDHEVQQVRGTGGYVGIEQLVTEALLNCSQGRNPHQAPGRTAPWPRPWRSGSA